MIILNPPGPGAVPLAPPLAEPAPAPSAWETVKAAFALENDVVAAIDFMSRPVFEPDPAFEPMSVLKDTRYEEYYLDRFVGVQSEAEARSVMARIDREERDRRTLAASGFGGFLAGVAAGAMSPTVLIPTAGWLGAVVRGGRAGRTALGVAEGALAVAGGVAIQEGILQATQETRTPEESLFAIGGAAILGFSS